MLVSSVEIRRFHPTRLNLHHPTLQITNPFVTMLNAVAGSPVLKMNSCPAYTFIEGQVSHASAEPCHRVSVSFNSRNDGPIVWWMIWRTLDYDSLVPRRQALA